MHPAYVAADALDHPCPTCHAAIGRPCIRIDENGRTRIRHVPCVKRCRAPITAEIADGEGVQTLDAPVDFSEPRHAEEGGEP